MRNLKKPLGNYSRSHMAAKERSLGGEELFMEAGGFPP